MGLSAMNAFATGATHVPPVAYVLRVRFGEDVYAISFTPGASEELVAARLRELAGMMHREPREFRD